MNENIFHKELIQEKINITFDKMGRNLKLYFEDYFINNIEGKCRNEGFIKQGTSKVINYSSGLLNSNEVIYDVTYEADVCTPYEGMIIKCIIKNINKIGIRAVISNENNPIMAFISREHNPSKSFDDYKEEENITIKMLGHRYELNDDYITIIGEIM